MKLLKIGRDATCDIVMHSEKVSSLHAEITILNSGDILLEDKGSRNGTFIMNQPIKPDKPVNIRRGDAIRFADVELQWGQVPMPDDNSAYQGIYGIGSHFNNDFQISGATVSRYHATVKHGRDGKMYIVDHSKNGTTVNGAKIMPNSPHLIKRNSAVVCGGVPVDLSRLPWPSPVWKYIAGMAASIVLIVAIGLGTYFLIPSKSKTYTDGELYSMYNKAVVMLICKYHYEVTTGNEADDEILYQVVPKQFTFNNGGIAIDAFSYTSATGLFVSNDGKIVTNLHVVKPWLFENRIQEVERVVMKKWSEAALQADIVGMLEGSATSYSALTSQIKVMGVMDAIYLVPQGKKFSNENTVRCSELSAGDDISKDVALIVSDKGELPNGCRFFNVTDSIDVSPEALRVGTHMYTMGFPGGPSLQIQETAVNLYAQSGDIIAEEGDYLFAFNAPSTHGASGSPIFNSKGMLIGILSSGYDETQGFNFGVKGKYVKEMIDQSKKNN